MTDDKRLDYWMLEILQEAMKTWWDTGERIRYTPTKELMENRFLDIGKFTLINRRLNEIQVKYDNDIIKGLSYDMIIKDEIVEIKTDKYVCPKCNRLIEPTESNKSYFMCMSCVQGWSIEELELIVFAKTYLCIDLKWYQIQLILEGIVKINDTIK